MFEGGVEDGVLVASVRAARSDAEVEVETNHLEGIRKNNMKTSCDVRSLGIRAVWRQLETQLPYFYQRVVMGVINVACTGLELSILPDLGTDRLLYLVTCTKRRQRPKWS